VVKVPPEEIIYPNRDVAYHNLFKKNGVGAEIGVCRGENASSLLVSTSPIKMHLVDTWDNEKSLGEIGDPYQINHRHRYHFELIGKDYHKYVREFFSKYIADGTIEVNKSSAKDFLENLDDNYFDWVYIDTSHFYEETFLTLEAAIRKTKIGGIIGMHDFFVSLREWNVISPVMHFIYNQNIKLISQSGPIHCPSVYLQRTR
tara:strand:+ start:891 stop:1496 length:606 start_codon:yes stop_codon:yes gene_type:complete